MMDSVPFPTINIEICTFRLGPGLQAVAAIWRRRRSRLTVCSILSVSMKREVNESSKSLWFIPEIPCLEYHVGNSEPELCEVAAWGSSAHNYDIKLGRGKNTTAKVDFSGRLSLGMWWRFA